MREMPVEFLARETTDSLQAIIDAYKSNPNFKAYSQYAIAVQRRHDEQIVKCIEFAMLNDLIVRCAVSSTRVCTGLQKLDALTQTPDQVANKIIAMVGLTQESLLHSNVIALSGPRASGKGRVRARLQEKIPELLRRSHSDSRLHYWKLGTLVRAIALLASTYSDQHKCSLQDALNPALMDTYCDLIVLTEEDLQWAIVGMGMRYTLKDIENGLLRSEQVASSVDLVAEYCQGYLIKLVVEKLQLMEEAKDTILLDGHPTTLTFVDTPHKFEFAFHDDAALGQWHTAQIVAQRASKTLAFGHMSVSDAVEQTVWNLEPPLTKDVDAHPSNEVIDHPVRVYPEIPI